MPRKESLSAIVPNKYYSLDATLKYIHNSSSFITAIIEQDNIQKKIKFPTSIPELSLGATYNFPKCFYSRNGWLTIREADQIQQISPSHSDHYTLSQIYENRNQLKDSYFSIVVEVLEIGAVEKKMKQGKELNVQKVSCFGCGYTVDLTLWNREMKRDLMGQLIVLEGVRLKMLTNTAIVLLSTVYTQFIKIQRTTEISYSPQMPIHSLSQIYVPRTIGQMMSDLAENKQSHSVINAKISEATIYDYEGCSNCHKKMENQNCQSCGDIKKSTFWVCQMIIEDHSGLAEVFVFDDKLLGVLKYAKTGSNLCCKIKSSIRAKEEQISSHIMSGIQSIKF